MSAKLETSFHKTIKKVSEDIESIKFNTAVASLMSLINEIYEQGFITSEYLRIFTLLLSPFAPHVTEEVWKRCELGSGFASNSKWPGYDEEKCKDHEVEIALQVNGKFRGKINCGVGLSQEEVLELAKTNELFGKFIAGKEIVKIIYVPNRLLNAVVK